MKRNLRKSFIAVLVILCIAAISILLLNALISRSLRTFLEDQVSTGSTYHVYTAGVTADVLTSSVIIKKAAVTEEGLNSKDQTAFLADEIVIRKFNVFAFLFRGKIAAGSVRIDSPFIRFTAEGAVDIDHVEDSTEAAKGIYELIRNQYSSVYFSDVEIINPRVRYFKSPGETKPVLSSESGLIRIEKMLVDEKSNAEDRLFDAENVFVKLNDLMFVADDSLYTFTVKSIGLSYADSSVTVDSLKVKPNFSKKEFPSRKNFQTDRFTIDLGKIEMRSVDIKELTERQNIDAALLSIDHFRMHVYRDKNPPLRKDVRPSLQQALKDLPVHLSIDTVDLEDGYITYEELMPGSAKAGKISFTGAGGTVYHLVNSEEANDTLTFVLKGLVENTARLNATLEFPMSQDNFYCRGNSGRLELSKVNDMLVNNARVYATSGTIDTLHFNFYATPAVARGRVTLGYRNLDVQLSDKSGDTTGLKERLFSFVAGRIIRKNNPSKPGEPMRTAEVDQEPVPQKFIINYIWKTILSGMLKTAGVPETKRKPV